MVYRFQTYKTDVAENKSVRTNLSFESCPINSKENSEVMDILISDGGESLFNYIDWLGLVNDPDLIVLSSQRHYYYDEEDLKNVNTVVNLKQLNQIKNLSVLLQSIIHIMPPKSNFIGCFDENNKHLEYAVSNSISRNGSDVISLALENGIISRIPFLNKIYNFIDSKTDRYMTRSEVYKLFQEHGFRILDMTELNGLTYFHAQKIRVFPE